MICTSSMTFSITGRLAMIERAKFSRPSINMPQQANTLPRPSKAYLDNCRWILDHHRQLREQHGIGWIAVHNGRVLAAGPGLGPVTDEAERLAPSHDIAYQFIDDATVIY